MGLRAHSIKSIPLLHLEASQFCLEKSNMGTLSPLPAEYPSPSTEMSLLLREVVLEFHRSQTPHSLSRLWQQAGEGWRPPQGLDRVPVIAQPRLLSCSPCLRKQRWSYSLSQTLDFSKWMPPSALSIWHCGLKAYIPIAALLFWEVCYNKLWPAQTENLEVALLFTFQLPTTANKKCTSCIIIATSFLRYLLFGSRALTACNKFGFYGKWILRYTTSCSSEFPTWHILLSSEMTGFLPSKI